MQTSATAVIGAGVAGLACAAALCRAGLDVVVFDKGRGIGGRLATRRRDGLQWDHGAQYLTAEGEDFARHLDGLPVWAASGNPRWRVGSPSQNALVKRWAEGIDVRVSVRITSMTRERGLWLLTNEKGTLVGEYQHVALTVPAPQAIDLLPAELQMDELTAVTMQPCWTLMAAAERALEVPAYLREPHADVAWVASDHTKPGRNASAGQYVLQASADWSRRHLEADEFEARRRLLELFGLVTGGEDEITFAQAHRWRFALTDQPLGTPCVYLPDQQLGLAGDWCLGHKAEHAYLSGRSLADAIVQNQA